jgi:phosphoribosylformylglycinamidine cyclo-ligase
MSALNYAEAGVNRQLADQFVDKIALLSKSTLKSAVGGYASLYALDKNRWLAASTDGVGTKLKLAFQLNQHRTVGIDLVAMSVNDLLCVGAEPLFFLDYFATGKLDPRIAEQVLEGITEGCKQAQCALVGGETAEMPDFYSSGEYDLAGFAVGVLNPKGVLPKKEIKPGDILIGIASSGCHSNGYSLLRKLIPSDPERAALISQEMITPTRIYSKSISPLVKSGLFKGLAHITGSGYLNIPRMSDQVSYEISLPPSAERPPIFEWIKRESRLSLEELAQTFNLGVGMVAVVAAQKSAEVLRKLKRAGEKAWVIGEVCRSVSRKTSQVILHEEGRSVRLLYR